MRPSDEDYSHISVLGYDFEYTRFYKEWIEGHFELGIRYADYNFKRLYASGPDDEYFIGSNDSIQAEDPGFGLRNLVIAWFPWADSVKDAGSNARGLLQILQGVGVELTWDNIRAKTVTSASAERPAYSDGTIVAKGPVLSYVMRIRNPTRITPYFGLGSVFYSDVSVTEGWWHLGFGSEADYARWRAAGSPGDPTGGWRRTFKVDTDNGLCWHVGAVVDLYQDWKLDLFYRTTEVVFDNTYEISSRGDVVERQYSKWDLSNETYGIGLRYTF